MRTAATTILPAHAYVGCVRLHTLLLFTCRPSRCRSLHTYIDCVHVAAICVQVLDFSRTVHEDLSNYDPASAWPVLLDEFVEHVKGSRLRHRCAAAATAAALLSWSVPILAVAHEDISGSFCVFLWFNWGSASVFYHRDLEALQSMRHVLHVKHVKGSRDMCAATAAALLLWPMCTTVLCSRVSSMTCYKELLSRAVHKVCKINHTCSATSLQQQQGGAGKMEGTLCWE
jgi:hypothetical protein